MPLVAAAVCPHPPLIVPEVAVGAASELDDLRIACDDAVTELRHARPDRLVLIGTGQDTAPVAPPYRASFTPWGVPLEIGHGAPLPLSLAVGVWLLDRAGWPAAEVEPHTVAPTGTPAGCAALGAALAERGRVALLVMGDGSARRGEKAPGYDDSRAAPLDATVAGALAAGDPDALLALDPLLCAELLVAGRAPWQVLAGAAAGTPWRGTLRYDRAPYGVAYLVASWTRR